MSSNDAIYITSVKDHYQVTHADVNSPEGAYYKRFTSKNLEDAILTAQEMQYVLSPEYGVVLEITREPKNI